MTRGRNVPLWTAIAATVVALALVAVHLWARSPARPRGARGAHDRYARSSMRGPRAPVSDRIVIVGLDDETRRTNPEVFQTRRGWADLIRALSRYDAKVIALDLFFTAPEVLLPAKLEDEVRAANEDFAALRAAGPPPLAPDTSPTSAARCVPPRDADPRRSPRSCAATSCSRPRSPRASASSSARTSAPARASLATPQPKKLALARHGEVADGGGGQERRPIHAIAVDFTLDESRRARSAPARSTRSPIPTACIRRVPLAIELGGRHYMPLGLAVALHDLGKTGRHRATSSATRR